eukprot:CAMPEP_0194059866 /NCGR_PEP_ID=MMETSP0009_2-20130614/70200_1 /TAXON_ID=210454 /ORGANISM="Grammatophora oceanica, Strain CCMP 410" /LENGTH=223 /DNA_ID=CAMNT_0038710585 /DNA_START=97 /DNA_END=768 /DNA_ORIENTATION=-
MMMLTVCKGTNAWVVAPNRPSTTAHRNSNLAIGTRRTTRHRFHQIRPTSSSSSTALEMSNEYDSWILDGISQMALPLTEENVHECLELLMDSDYGAQMFGRHPMAADIGITGSIGFVELDGPEVVLSLHGEFWHKRSTVLGRAAMWLNSCMPEIMQVNVRDREELQDFMDVLDQDTGELLYVHDKRSPDFNGDRGTMEYQGIDPDVRGPFPGGSHQGIKINPV